MTDIRELLTEAAADVDVGPSEPVALLRQGLSRRRRARVAVLGAVAAVATAIAVPVSLAGSSPDAQVGPATPSLGRSLQPLPLFEVLNPTESAGDSRTVSMPSGWPGHPEPDTHVRILSHPTLVLHATGAAVRKVGRHHQWYIALTAPEASDLVGLQTGPHFHAFVAKFDGKWYPAINVQGTPQPTAMIAAGYRKHFAVSMAEALTTFVLVSQQVSVTVAPDCAPPVKPCRRVMKELERHARLGH